MGKDKEEKSAKKEKRKSVDGAEGGEGGEAQTRPIGVSVIARPLADEKLAAKVLKVVKKGPCVVA